jgi:trans-aconitate 2-methyltransferase
MTWDPQQYLRYADERSRPFHELVARIPVAGARLVYDLGCGPGELTASLAGRWPAATIVGIDNDEAMVSAAQALANRSVRFERGDIADWSPRGAPDVVIANASLQWVPQHRQLLPVWIEQLAAGGALAFQVPGNFEDPHHLAIGQLLRSPPWDRLPALVGLDDRRARASEVGEYLEQLATMPEVAGVDAWVTEYQHILHGSDPVLEWVRGTALRPVLARLDTSQQTDFCAQLGAMLRELFPSSSWGTRFPFRRIFVVAVRR